MTPSTTIQAYHHKNLQSIYLQHDYSWSHLDRGVPPLVLNKFPDDLHRINSTQQKKSLFFKSILPMAMLANEEITAQRSTLNEIFKDYDQTGKISTEQQEELATLNTLYRIKTDPLIDEKARARLLRRVDTIPESLVLAQAANESGWGTSRFARQANNIFGEWTFTPGTGLVPENRPEGEIYEVRRFPSLYQSVRSYMRNINTHRAYLSLRQEREKLRQANLEISGIKLSTKLDNYSIRREDYSLEIQALIESNELEKKIASAYLMPDALTPPAEELKPKTGLFGSKESMKSKL